MNGRETIIEQRNSVLSRLNACYPGSLGGASLYRIMISLFPTYTRNHCVRDLYYLEQKLYVTRKHPRTGKVCRTGDCEWHEAMWVLTAAGNEIACKLIEDPALEV